MKASIIIRVYNAEKTIERAIQSALHQNFPEKDFEIIIVNDGSTDGTRRLLEQYVSLPNVKIFDQENKGGTATANKGLEESRGEYVTILDSDDAFESDLLKELSSALDAHPETIFAYPDYYEKKNGSKIYVSPKNIFETTAVGILFRRERLKEAGWYRDNIFFAEYDLMLRTMDDWKGIHISKPLFIYYRSRIGNTSDADRVAKGIDELLALHSDKSVFIKKIRGY
ncbi:MAG: glycosyltransferase family A protein [bacterium]|nr:glycosyltransferase family A protein [bacterium]